MGKKKVARKKTKKSAAKKQPKKFMVTYHTSAAALKKMQKSSRDELMASMQEWMAWFENCGEHLVEMGAPLCDGVNLSQAGEGDSKRRLTGYSILQADGMAKVKRMLKKHPHLAWHRGCEIDVYEMTKIGK